MNSKPYYLITTSNGEVAEKVYRDQLTEAQWASVVARAKHLALQIWYIPNPTA